VQQALTVIKFSRNKDGPWTLKVEPVLSPGEYQNWLLRGEQSTLVVYKVTDKNTILVMTAQPKDFLQTFELVPAKSDEYLMYHRWIN
jgi:hypothetical protein